MHTQVNGMKVEYRHLLLGYIKSEVTKIYDILKKWGPYKPIALYMEYMPIKTKNIDYETSILALVARSAGAHYSPASGPFT